MGTLARHWTRIAVTLVPLIFALLHASGVMPLGFLQRLDDVLYDARLRATMPRTLDERIVIVDIDEKSLAELGRWPWGRNRMAQLTDELFARQQVAVVGFDVVFAEPDDSSGLKRLRQLAQSELKDQPGFAGRVDQLSAGLDYDAAFARSLRNRPVVLGYYFSSGRASGKTGVLPAPVIRRQDLDGRPIRLTSWNGYAANIEQIAQAAPVAGFFNPIVDIDGVVRSVPLIAEHGEAYYESLSLAMFRLLAGQPTVEPGFPRDGVFSRNYQGLESVVLRLGKKALGIPVDDRVAALVPFRGPGGVQGGSYRYVSASDLVSQRLAEGSLKGKIVLVGTTAPGLQDLRSTPMGETYPGVETHANMISGLLDGRLMVKPDYAIGYDVMVLLLAGVALALALPLISAPKAVLVSVGVLAAMVGLNFWLFLGAGLVMPLAAALAMILTAFGLNMSYGYFIESRSKRELANLFGTYVPPELVDEMVKDPDSYSMKATNKELTVMFCDMRGFTKMSERMGPVQLQELLNAVFNRLTDVIRATRGTIDKYMGDCVMAFWGAPVDTAEHARLAVRSAMDMAAAVRRINDEHRQKGLPEIGVGIGLNTGMMCVGDMGSQVRRSYTVIGDAVNLGSRLEGLSKAYGVDIVVSESTRRLAPDFAWQELDRVRVKGKEQAVTIFTPVAPADRLEMAQAEELRTWAAFLREYRGQDWEQCEVQLLNLRRMNPKKFLYELYSERVASMRLLPFDPEWDGATNFETK
ncbi:CHASE2 domain-containing protein [Ramlibacter sp. Leaf400]|uniref:CHASE2 domain-containing protein n=1 Tax=Ramlibacter sp. Leaf400 TaxID=1736365 RepID=UPI0006F60A0E|nr:adenylate/guanylate cyclase domain-containing protein [Ramlibacter sp. Leaf400]KQT12367.1 guanylate cyclase [Ramlibacter sp. Leaf400]